MKKNPKSSQNLLVTIGIEKSTLPVAERIARENLHYALLVFIPVFVAAVFLLFRYSSLPIWIGFGLQLITGALLVMRLQMYKKNSEHVLAANEAIYWHVFTSLIYFVLCASKASSTGDLWFIIALTFFALFALFTIPPTYTALMLFAQAAMLILLFPESAFSELPAERIMALIVAVLYFSGIHYFWKNSRVTAHEQERAEKLFLEQIARTDSLTGMLNYHGGNEMIESYIREHPDGKAYLIKLVIIDLRLFNELYGTETGNALLKVMVREIGSVFGEKGIIIRNGGDSFYVFMPDADPEQAEKMIHEYAALDHTLISNGAVHKYSVAVGYTVYPDQGSIMAELFTNAERAVSHVRFYGGNCAVFDASMIEEGRTYLRFNLRDIAMGIPGALLVYKAQDDEQILFANDELVSILECDSIAGLLNHVNHSFRTLVHPEDLDRVEKSIREQTGEGGSDRYYIEFRVMTGAGREKQMSAFGKRVSNPHYGDVFYVFLYDARNQEEAVRKALMSNPGSVSI